MSAMRISQKANNDHVTVRDCLTWPTAEDDGNADNGNLEQRFPTTHVTEHGQQQPQSTNENSARQQQSRQAPPQQREEQRTVDEYYERPAPPQSVTPSPQRVDEGTAGEALRGWPQRQQQEQERQQEQRKRNKENEARQVKVGVSTAGKKPERNAKKTAAAPKNHGRRSVVTGEPEEAYIGDLLSQKYLEDYVEKSRAERSRKENAETAQRGKKGNLAAKGNKTAELRSIAVANKLYAEPGELWKMPRFANKAQPRVTSLPQKEKAGERGRIGGGKGKASTASSVDQQARADRIVFADHDTYNYYDCDQLAEGEIYE